MKDEFDNFNFEKIILAKDYSTDALCARIKKFSTNTPGWITDMVKDPKAQAATCTVHEAMIELNVRRVAYRNENKVKDLITEFTTDKVVTIAPDGYSVQGRNAKANLVIVGGHILRGDNPESISPAVQTVIARENVVEAVVFPITSPANKANIEVVCEDKSNKMEFPLFPVSSVMGTQKSRTELVDIYKKKISDVPDIISKIVSVFPTTLKWTGNSFAAALKYSKPSKFNASSLFTILDEHRGIRGPDTGVRADATRGYYYGYMPTSLYRAAYVVSDILMLGSVIGTNCLEIKRMDGLFSNIVLQSLVVNGWVIRVTQDFLLPTHPKIDLSDESSVLVPGLYNKVPFLSCLVHEGLDDKVPTVDRGIVYSTSIRDYLDNIPRVKGRYTFLYCFFRDELAEYSKYLYPTAHAHSGQVIYMQAEKDQGLDMIAYIKRTIRANTYKSYHVYTRQTFYHVDDFRYQWPVKLTQKPIKDFSIVEIELAQEYITPWVYKGEYVKLAPDTAALVSLVNKSVSDLTSDEITELASLFSDSSDYVPTTTPNVDPPPDDPSDSQNTSDL